MIPATVFLSRYDQPTIDKAISFIALALEIAKMPGGDLRRAAAALDWVCEHAGGVDRSKLADEDLSDLNFREKTGLHSYLGRLHKGNLWSIIRTQSDKIVGLKIQITQMKRGYERKIKRLSAELTELRAQMLSDQGRHEAETGRLRNEVERLSALINTPEILDFGKAVQLEGIHQRERHGSDNDAGKTDADWFWLIGYLAGKALHNPPNDMPAADSKLHRIVTIAAAAANWHAAVSGASTFMRPGIAAPAETPRTCEMCAHDEDPGFYFTCQNCVKGNGNGHHDYWTAKPDNTPGDGTDKTTGDAL